MPDRLAAEVAYLRDLNREIGVKHDRLASLLEKLRPYADHRRVECDSGLSRCVCGMADLLAEIPGGG